VSGTFELLCASHTPALELDDDTTLDVVIGRLAAGAPEHPHCDLLIGRRSGGLVEVGCPPSAGRVSARVCYHSGIEWADASWLRLLAAVTGDDREQTPAVAAAVAQVPRCWTPARVAALAGLL
jgi:hypothetical protein